MILTYFVADLHCQHCGQEIRQVQVQSPLLGRWVNGQHGVDTLHIGDRVDVSLGDFKSAYIKVRDMKSGEPIRVLETWTCPSCRQLNWVVIEILRQQVHAIASTVLSRQTLNSVHFVTDLIYEEAFQPLVGESLWIDGDVRPDFIDLLNAKLPEAEC